MALNLIKEYLIGIGFKIDENSLNDANKSIDQTQDNIKKFNDENKKGFSESGDSLKDLFTLFQSSSGTLAQLFPEARGPFKSMIRDITLLRKLYSDFTQMDAKKKKPSETPKASTKQQEKPQQQQAKSNPASTALSVIQDNKSLAPKNLIDSVLDATKASEGLASKGGSALKLFSGVSIGAMAAAAVGVVAVTVAIKKLVEGIADLAKQDIEDEKLSRQLWTTKENAKEVSSALKTMGVSMQDLWLSPTLLKQFNQLRQDSAALKLPPEYTQNLKIVQGIGLEFSRLRQLGSLAFQWIGNYILKYAAGPLNDFRQGMQSFNSWLIKNIPEIAKVIGSTIGVIIKILLTIGEVLGTIISTSLKIRDFIFGSIPEGLQKILKIIGIIALAIMTGPIGVIILLIALIQDVITYFKGGKSVIGGLFSGIKEGMNSIKEGWDYYYNKAVEVFEKIKKKAQEIWDTISWPFKKMGEFGEFAGEKVKEFASNINLTSAPAYATPNVSNTSTQTKSNSDNTISNTNTFNVYGNNSQATANAIANKTSGLNTRNMQGVL